MSEKKARIDRQRFKELRNNRKKRDKISRELQEWKEKTCDLPDVDCYPDQLMEFTGQIVRDDCKYGIDGGGNRVLLSGTVDRLPKGKLAKALEFRNKLRDLDEKLVDKLDGISEAYGTFPDLINIQTGEVTEHETASEVKDVKPSKKKKDDDGEQPPG